MSFTWEEICSDWILKNCEKYSQDECVNAFTIIDKYLGREWLEDKYKALKGPVVIIPILELGRIISILEGHQGFDTIIEKIRKDQELDLARTAAFYIKEGLDVEIEPEIKVGEKTKVPDLKVKFGKTPVYFEAYKPSSSQKYRSLLSNSTRIALQVLEDIVDGINFQIYLVREPSNIEVENLVNACKSTPVKNDVENHYLYGDLARIIVKPRKNPNTIDNGRYLNDGIRRSFIVISKILGSGIQKSCLVGMPFTDQRVDRILRKTVRGLHMRDPGGENR